MLQRDAISGDRGSVGRHARFRTVPLDEVTNRVIVGALRTRRG